MTEADKIFSRFPSFVKEYIYSNSWTSLRPVQLDAARIIFEGGKNLLLSSSTASGKTEAAIFPVLTDLYENPPKSTTVSVLYVAPLKSLINDQFERMEGLLRDSGIPLTHWHGDVGASHKSKLLKNPEGILQITPESLESMLINRSNDIPRLFGELRFVIIDEIHALIGTDRGNQIICQLSRIASLIGKNPRRIGLSATLGDPEAAAMWLGAGSGMQTEFPIPEKTPLKWRLALEHFYVEDAERDQTKRASERTPQPLSYDAGYEYLYDAVYGKKALVFSNSREETEYVTATLRQIAAHRGEDDIFLIHHGNLSASLREDAEQKMKDSEVFSAVTCATVTMELGIDIGRLERVAQMGAPTTVSGFLQRLGRSGRRGLPPEMIMVYRESTPLPNAPLPEIIPWELLRGIAIIDLYSDERFIEPPREKKMPMSLLFHQTLSVLASGGELKPKALAAKILELPPFRAVTKETYRALLVSMINSEHLELTEDGGLIVGLAGERIINSFKFYAVFKDSEDFTVRCDSEEIGTITTPPPVGDRFALAGRVWEVKELDVSRRLVFVSMVAGKMEVSWPGEGGEIHTRLLEAMKSVLSGNRSYAYLGENAKVRLEHARTVAKHADMANKPLVFLGGQSYALFPWLGTRSFRTLKRLLKKYASELGLSDIQSEGCCYITFRMKGNRETFFSRLSDIVEERGLEPTELIQVGECPMADKYDEYIPTELLVEAYAADSLRTDEVLKRIKEWCRL